MAIRKKDDRSKRESARQLRDLDSKELASKLAEESEALMRIRFKHATAALENTSELKAMRRQIARIATVLNEKMRNA